MSGSQPTDRVVLGAQHLPKTIPKLQTRTLVVRLVLPHKDATFMVSRP